MALSVESWSRRSLDEIEAFQFVPSETSTEEIQAWLNDNDTGWTAELQGWVGALLIKKDGNEILTVVPGEFLIRDITGYLFRLTEETLRIFWKNP